MLRVIAGKYGGRKLKRPESDVSRPTTDRAKEAIFSMIQFQIPQSIVLDLFSGSGSLAIEAISRGAMKAIAVDSSKKAIKVINDNKEKIQINNLVVRKNDVIEYISSIGGTKYDFIFIDPPYKEIDLYNKTLEIISREKLLNDVGKIILEIDDELKIIIPKGLIIQKNKKYGKTTILIIANNI